MVYSFKNDYSYGAHERILERLCTINREQVNSYGNDPYSQEATCLIQKELKHNSDVYFLSGGTQTNLIAAAAFLRPYQGVISAEIGHVAGHESGAIEATGHKILELPSYDGKLNAQQIKRCLDEHWGDPARTHLVQPGMVYLSHPTEVGSIYSKSELEDISSVCKERDVLLYIDGARMGCALTAPENDVTLEDLAALTDAFFIGGTKMGGLFGEALVINNPNLSSQFLYVIKQRGGRMCKGWLIGLQFAELFRDGLYYSLAKHANEMARMLADGIRELSIPFFVPPATNQLFPIFRNETVHELERNYLFIIQAKPDPEHTAIRLVTSWATPPKVIEQFLQDLSTAIKTKSI